MTDEQTKNSSSASEGAQAPQINMQILAQFVSDMSFENILAQKGTGGDVTPDVEVAVNLDVKKRDAEHQFKVTAETKITSKDKTTGNHLFIMELDYVGVFHVEGVPKNQLHPFLLIECPRILFPFLRRIVSDVTRDGGFPPLNLENIDWVQLYRENMKANAAESQENATKLDT